MAGPSSTGGTTRHASRVDPEHFGLVKGAQPVRVIRPRTARLTMPGWFPTAKGTLPSLRTETLLELDGLPHFEVNPAVVMMASQPHHLHYREPLPDGGTVVRTYTPDLALLFDDGSISVIDFKPTRRRDAPAWDVKEDLVRAAYERDHGVTFRTVTEASIKIEPRRTNVSIMLMHRVSPGDPEADVAVAAAIEHLGLPTTIGAITDVTNLPAPPKVDRAFTTILRLAIAGGVSLHLGIPLGRSTPVLERKPRHTEDEPR